jgi:hypothetical protein
MKPALAVLLPVALLALAGAAAADPLPSPPSVPSAPALPHTPDYVAYAEGVVRYQVDSHVPGGSPNPAALLPEGQAHDAAAQEYGEALGIAASAEQGAGPAAGAAEGAARDAQAEAYAAISTCLAAPPADGLPWETVHGQCEHARAAALALEHDL